MEILRIDKAIQYEKFTPNLHNECHCLDEYNLTCNSEQFTSELLNRKERKLQVEILKIDRDIQYEKFTPKATQNANECHLLQFTTAYK